MKDKKLEDLEKLTQLESAFQESIAEQVFGCEASLDVLKGFRSRDKIISQHSYASILVALQHILTCTDQDRDLVIKRLSQLCISKMYNNDNNNESEIEG